MCVPIIQGELYVEGSRSYGRRTIMVVQARLTVGGDAWLHDPDLAPLNKGVDL